MRRFSWVPFAVALAAFALPFATVSCSDQRVEPSGADFVLRSPPENTGPTEDELDLGSLVVELGGGLATAAFLSFALALLAALRSWRPAWVPLCGLVGLGSLWLLKTRTGGEAAGGIAEVDVRFGALAAAGSGAIGVLAGMLVWLRGDGLRALRLSLPAVGAGLLVVGYLLPHSESQLESAYVDSLDLRGPRLDTFWLCAPAVGVFLLARREALTRRGAFLALALLTVAGIAASEDIWSAWRDEDVQPAAASFVLLTGVLLSSVFAARVARRGRAEPQAEELPGPAPAPAPASRPDGPSAPGSAGSPPAAH